jgi:hypothetical protein
LDRVGFIVLFSLSNWRVSVATQSSALNSTLPPMGSPTRKLQWKQLSNREVSSLHLVAFDGGFQT